MRCRLLIVLFLLGAAFAAQGQLIADYTTLNSSGCSPFTAGLRDISMSGDPIAQRRWTVFSATDTFTQTTSGANANFLLLTPGNYAVKLVVTDINGVSDSITRPAFFTVNAAPTINYVLDTTLGCDSMVVCFTNLSTPGCGTLSQCIIDFGDGVVDTNCASQVCHSYHNSGSFTPSFILRNSCGCASLAANTDTVTVIGVPKPNFFVLDRSACVGPHTVTFTNLTNGPPGTNYYWDFDNDISTIESTAQNPTHTFSNGQYHIALITENSLGCRDTLTRKKYITVGFSTVAFGASDTTICTGDVVFFTDQTPGNVIDRKWLIRGNGQIFAKAGATTNHKFTNTGFYDVELVVTYGSGCKDTLVKSAYIQVGTRPVVNFTPTDTVLCNDVSTVLFEGLTPGIASWRWVITESEQPVPDSIVIDTVGNPISFTRFFDLIDTFDVYVQITDSFGCRDSIEIKDRFFYSPLRLTVAGIAGCMPLEDTIELIIETFDSITFTSWDIGMDTSIEYTNTTAIIYNDSTFGCDSAGIRIETATGCVIQDDLQISCAGDTFPLCPVFDRDSTCYRGEFLVHYDSCIDTTIEQFIEWQLDDSTYRTFNRVDTYSFVFEGNCGTFYPQARSIVYGCFSSFRVMDTLTVHCPVARADIVRNCDDVHLKEFVNQSIAVNAAVEYTWTFYNLNGQDIVTNVFDTIVRYDTLGNYKVLLHAVDTITGCQDSLEIDVLVHDPTAVIDINDKDQCVSAQFILTNVSDYTFYERWYMNSISSGNAVQGPLGGIKIDRTMPDMFDIYLVNVDSNECADTVVMEDIKAVDVVPNFTVDTTFACAPHVFQFTDQSVAHFTEINSYQWNFGELNIATDTSTQQNPSYEYTSPGTFTVVLIITDTLGCSFQVDKFSYVTYNKPGSNFFVDTVSCSDVPFVFRNQSSGIGLSYLWEFKNQPGQTSTQRDSLVIYYDTTGFYYPQLVVTDNRGCRDTMVQQIEIRDPFAAFEADTTYLECQDILKINDSSIYADRWEWFIIGNGDTVISSAQNPNSLLTPGIYSIQQVAISDLGCTDTTFKADYITVDGPFIDFEILNNRGCVPQDIGFVISSANIDSIAIIHGDGNVTFETLPVRGRLDSLAIDTFFITYNDPGQFVPGVSYPNVGLCFGGGVFGDTVSIDSIIMNLAVDSFNFCNSGTALFTANSYSFLTGNPAVQNVWHFDDQTLDTGQFVSKYYDTAGFYGVRLISSSLSGCIDTVSRRIEVPQGSLASLFPPQVNACDTLSALYTYNIQLITAPIDSIFWFFEGGLVSTNDTLPILITQPGNYDIQLVIVDANGCTDTVTDVLTVTASPQASFNIMDQCFGQQTSFTYTGTSQLPISLLSWDMGNGDTTRTGSNVAYQFSTAGVYNVGLMVTDTLGCSDDTIVPMEIFQLPVAQMIFTPDNEICLGDTGSIFDISTHNDPNSVLVNNNWDVDNDLVVDQQNVNPVDMAGFGTGNFTINFWVEDANGCRDTTQGMLTVHQLPDAQIDPDTFCQGAQQFITDVSILGDGQIVDREWSVEGNVVPGNGTQIDYVFPGMGVQQVSLVVIDEFGCTDSISQPVLVSPAPSIVGALDTSVCPHSLITLSLSGADSFAWPNSSNINLLNPNGSLVEIFANDDLNIEITGITDLCGSITQNIQINVYDNVTVNASAFPTRILQGSSTDLSGAVSGNYSSLQWTPSNSLTCPSCLQTEATPLTSTRYRLDAFFTVDSMVCSDFDTVVVEVYNECSDENIFLPTGFTPGGDQINDVFYVRGIGIAEVTEFRIYDRWGRVVFQNYNFAPNDDFEGWNGTKQESGEPVQVGVYVYKVEALCTNGQFLIKSGNVTLVR